MQPPWDPRQPPGVRPVQGAGLWRWVAGGIVALLLVVAAFLAPIPVLYRYLPGPVRDVERLIEIEGARTYSSEGALFLTTVSVDTRVTLAEWIAAAFDPSSSIVGRDSVTKGESLEQLRRRQEAEMRDSKLEAEVVALRAVGLVRPGGDGVRVAETVPDSPAGGRLRRGDLIVAVDGVRTPTTCDVGRLVNRHDPGDSVVVTILRKGDRRTLRIRAASAPGASNRPFLGVIMRNVNFSFDSPVTVDIATGEIAGPSAGLMFALTLYDRLTPDDLTGGRRIAGTGTIACDGEVGGIGGIEQKVAGAEGKGAEIFLAPAANAEAARAVAKKVRVVAIATFVDALKYLERLDS